jgi:hypothetical protein
MIFHVQVGDVTKEGFPFPFGVKFDGEPFLANSLRELNSSIAQERKCMNGYENNS